MRKLREIKKNMKLNSEKQAFIQEWVKAMTYTKTYNAMMDTFEIMDLEKKEYGWYFRIVCPYGLTFGVLENLTPYIEDSLKCHFEYSIHVSKEFAICYVIYEKSIVCNQILFEPQKVKPWQLYLGVTVTGAPIINDVNVYPFCLIAGMTRRGKNGALNHALISLINSCTPEQVRILYYQGAKGDGRIYKNCAHTYAWSTNNFEELLEMCRYCMDQIKKRTKLFEHMYDTFQGDNIMAYNKLHKHEQLSYIYLVIDEFMVVVPEPSDTKEIKDTKNEIIDCLKSIAQFGGAMGVSYIICHQKPQKELCPTFLKNMSNCRVCFGFIDEVCSRIVLESDKAKGLPPRRAYIITDGEPRLMFTTDLTDRMEPYLKAHYKKDRRDLFSDLRKLKKISEESKKIMQDHKEEVKNSGKEDVKHEEEIKKKDEELKEKAAAIQQKQEVITRQEEEIKKLQEQLKQIKYKQMEKEHDKKYSYDMVKPPSVEDNIKNIPGFVPYKKNSGKEIIK